MSEIRYFQRYSQRENVITNNTLSFLRKLYLNSRSRFEELVEGFVVDKDVTFNVGPRFQQQVGTGRGVIDGLLSQDSFTLAIETKKYDNFGTAQLERHLSDLEGKPNALLLAISRGLPSQEVMEHTENYRQRTQKVAAFTATTFEELIVAVEEQLTDYDQEMLEVVNDYRAFCEEEGLIDFKERTMLAVATSASRPQNQEYDIYYEPKSRNHSRGFAYLGLYYSKAIRHVGRITKVVLADWDGKEVTMQPGQSTLTPQEMTRLTSMFEDTDYFNINRGHRFYFVDEFADTTYKKGSFGPLRGKKYFMLNEIQEFDFVPGLTGPEIASKLDQREWL